MSTQSILEEIKKTQQQIQDLKSDIETKRAELKELEDDIKNDQAKLDALEGSIALVLAYIEAEKEEKDNQQEDVKSELRSLAIKSRSGAGVSYADIENLAVVQGIDISTEFNETGKEEAEASTAA